MTSKNQVPILKKTGIALGEGQYITHEGTVMKLGVQDFGLGVAHWIVTIDDKAHVVSPVIPSEQVEEGVSFEEQSWRLIALLLHRVSELSGKTNELTLELKESKESLSKSKEMEEKMDCNLRQAQLDLEALQTGINDMKMAFEAQFESLKDEGERMRKEMAKMKEEMLEAVVRKCGDQKEEIEESVCVSSQIGALDLMASGLPAVASSSSCAVISSASSLDTDPNEPKISLERAEAYLTRNGVSNGAEGKWTVEASVQAAADNRLDVLKWLRKLGVLDTTTPPNWTGTELARKSTLLRSVNGLNAVHAAVKEGHLDVLKWFHSLHLFDHKATITGYYYYSYPQWDAAHVAAFHGHLEVLQWMKNCNLLDAHNADRGGQTIAHIAAGKNHLEILKWLQRERLLDAKERDDASRNVSHHAAYNLEILKWLKSVGLLDLKTRTIAGKTLSDMVIGVTKEWLNKEFPSH